ncbi:MAG TPA: isocitrate lyase/phosphoenolpyruvate mutase family protein [Patescibacteria group bacterium]|nr:isocitrate lyase/phosphoenolpyruvate mutase family protein [Gammaproteobacteria bacterium]HWA51442.1 isocitrate lyase/phosphoenolpyruvate mutase family protein [Patescibacteria group bacterium]
MTNLKQLNKAEIFTQLHYGKNPLILPNAWDVLSAKLFAQAGAKAIGTTSAGIAASLGLSDGQKVPKEMFLSITEQIVNAVDVPVTVDIEAGYGFDLLSICDTVKKVIDMGGAGINIEDTIFDPSIKLEDMSEQCKKISAIKSTCENCNYPLFINARTDVYWLNPLPEKISSETALRRLLAYQNCGADGLFIPGLTNLFEISRLVRAVSLPVNILGGAWVKSAADLATAGVSRISVGSTPCRATAAFIQNMAHQLIDQGDFSIFEDTPSYQWLNELFNNT